MSGAETIVLGSVSFSPARSCDWRDDEPTLREMHDAACRSIVRLECEAEEREARIAVLEEQARIIVDERDEAREDAKRATYDAAQETIKVGTVKSHWIEACRERDEAREAIAVLRERLNEMPDLVLENEKKNHAWGKAELWQIERYIIPSIRALCRSAVFLIPENKEITQ